MKKNAAEQFNERYTDLEAETKIIRQSLLKYVAEAKKISKKADKLYRFGNAKCYDNNNNHDGLPLVKPIDGINDLGYKMDILDQLSGLEYELKTLANSFDMRVKRRV